MFVNGSSVRVLLYDLRHMQFYMNAEMRPRKKKKNKLHIKIINDLIWFLNLKVQTAYENEKK